MKKRPSKRELYWKLKMFEQWSGERGYRPILLRECLAELRRLVRERGEK